MLRIITLLNQKNHYLEKFYSLNEGEILNFSKGIFENLESFYQTREKILDMIKYLDSELDLAQRNTDEAAAQSLKPEERRLIKEGLAVKDEYVSRILAQDLEILSCIESAKSMIIRELQDVRRSRKVVGSYKSKTFNRRLDEEA
jgi:hypothetical protein